ncbi:hypothetical protein [Arcicella rigui]|uniref:Uncharacterized protein n=1 Tax=Arcicella rigui TaxID=797020 RepID=A0ABU5QB18_9BACT|nr:hypothetical protein [Arcicella rigui]MEA5139832.1 hypothetical protein [Arcicella rigui]
MPKVWLLNPLLQDSGFPLEVVESTGEVLRKKRIAEYQGLTFKLLPSAKSGGYTMLLSGSIHKYRNNGKHNYDRFTVTHCVTVIEELFTVFGIDPKQAVLHSLEFGVNIKLPYPVQKLIQSVVVNKNKPYEAIAKSRRNGVVCVRENYEFKIYDKGFVCGLDENIIRVEYHVSRMKDLEGYGIVTLSDLTDKTKVNPLLDLLIGALDDTVFIPTDSDLSSLTKKQKINFHAMGKPYTWKDYTPKQRFDKRIMLSRILEKCKAFDYQKDLKERVLEEWKTLFIEPIEALQRSNIYTNISVSEAHKNVMFSPLVYSVKTLQNHFLENRDNKEKKDGKSLKLTIDKRYCKTCGKEIIGSRKNSLFCRKSTNPNAKQCRNKDSNKRRTLKAQIMRAKVNNQFLRVTYKNLDDLNQSTFSDILHSSEIAVHRGLLNTIVSLEILPNEPEPALYQDLSHAHHGELLTGKDAVEVLEELTAENMQITL